MSTLITPICGCPQQTVFQLVLFLHQIAAGANHNQEVIIGNSIPNGFGTTAVNDWFATNTSDVNGFVVARAEGLHMQASQKGNVWYFSFNLVFEDERFAGSTLQVMGIIAASTGELSIMGGTGQFKRATGNIDFVELVALSAPGYAVRKLNIDIYTPKAQ